MCDKPQPSSKPIKGILKHKPNGSSGSEPHLTWDEANIELTEAQKDSTMKVDEPKTPYIRYNPETDEVLNMPADAPFASAHDEPEDFRLDPGNESDRSSTSSRRKERKVSMSDDGWDTDEDDMTEKEKQERHEKFEKKRAMHYNMGNVLRHKDEVDEEDDDGDNEMTSRPPPPVPSVPHKQ